MTIPQIEIKGEKFVVVPVRDYNRLLDADRLPPLPQPDARGYTPAIEFTRASIARDIILDRRAMGLSQAELAKLAGIRQETICRIESGKHKANVRTIEKIDAALKKAAGRRRRAG
ncbi:MAG: helix-turn-helix transcriptional regulator [Phycisphaerales bacterium]